MDHPYLTFPHRSGVTFYTLTYVFAESCVFDKQSLGNLSLRPLYFKGQTLSRSYGRLFAEFLKGISLVRLSLLDSTTCVGLRYGIHVVNPNEVFLGSALLTLDLSVDSSCDPPWSNVWRIYLPHLLRAPTGIQ